MNDREKSELLDGIALAVFAAVTSAESAEHIRQFSGRVDDVLEMPHLPQIVGELFVRLKTQSEGLLAHIDRATN